MKSDNTHLAIRPLSSWLGELGITPVTGWRWRQRGWIKTITIAGRQYISVEAISEFKRRAEGGEFEVISKDGSAK